MSIEEDEIKLDYRDYFQKNVIDLDIPNSEEMTRENKSIKDENLISRKRKAAINLDKYLDNKKEEIVKSENNIINDMDFFTSNQEENIKEDSYEEISIEDKYDEDITYKDEVEKIKKLRNMKRISEHKEETYDPAYIELKSVTAKECIKQVYNLLNKEQSDQSDSDKELSNWEMSKLRFGMGAATSWANNKVKEKTKECHEFKDLIKVEMRETNIEELMNQLREEINTEEVYKLIKQLNEECLKVRLQNYQTEIEENHHNKLAEIQKIEDYIQQYSSLKNIYKNIVKQFKQNEKINLNEIKEKFSEDTFYFSE